MSVYFVSTVMNFAFCFQQTKIWTRLLTCYAVREDCEKAHIIILSLEEPMNCRVQMKVKVTTQLVSQLKKQQNTLD